MDNTDIESIAKTTKFYIGRKNQGLKRINKNSIGSELTSELLPFKNVMLRQLKRRGFNVSNVPFKNIIPLYFNEFLSNQNIKSNYYQPINCFEFSENPIFKFSVSDNLNGNVLDYRNRDYFLQIGNVVDSIINNFKISKIKKQSCNHLEELTSDELIQANEAEKIERELQKKLFNQSPITKKDIKNIILFGLIVWLLIYMTGK
jgi:hypothetical protein